MLFLFFIIIIFATMIKTSKYHFMLLIIFMIVLSVLTFKPIYHLTNLLNDDDIELCEKSQEEPIEENDCCNTEDLFCFINFDFGVDDITSIIKKSKNRYIRQIIEIYKDVLIPPPKSI